MKKAFVFVMLGLLIINLSAGFEVHTPAIKIGLKAGSSGIQTISVFNDKDEAKTFTIEKEHGRNFYEIGENTLEVGPKTYGTVTLTLGSPIVLPGLYLDRVIISDGTSEKGVPVVVEVSSKGKILFDTIIEAKIDYLAVPGSNFGARVKVYNIGAVQDAVEMLYGIQNFGGDMIHEKTEVLSVREPIEIRKEFSLPESLPEGLYVFSVAARQGNYASPNDYSYSVTSQLFIVEQRTSLSPVIEADSSKTIGFFIILFLMVSVIVLSYYWNKRVLNQGKEWRTKVSEIRAVKFSDAARSIRRLNYQKHLLEKAYGSHYVTRESYEQGRKEINNMISKLKKRL